MAAFKALWRRSAPGRLPPDASNMCGPSSLTASVQSKIVGFGFANVGIDAARHLSLSTTTPYFSERLLTLISDIPATSVE